MAVSYRVHAPILAGSNVFIHGTDSLRYALYNWTRASRPLSSPAGFVAESFLRRHPAVTGVQGHSFGAAIALSLAQKYGLRYTGFGRPGLTTVPGDRANFLDPVSLFLRKNGAVAGHSISSYSAGLGRHWS